MAAEHMKKPDGEPFQINVCYKLENGTWIVKCQICGKQFSANSNQRTCSECKKAKRQKADGTYTRIRRKEVKSHWNGIVKEARKMGVTYGKMMALRELDEDMILAMRIGTVARMVVGGRHGSRGSV